MAQNRDFHISILESGGKPSTWFPPGGHVEQLTYQPKTRQFTLRAGDVETMERTQSRDDDPRNARLALLMWMAILRKHDPRNPATHCTESASIGELDIETHTASNPTTGEYMPPHPHRASVQ